MDDHPYKRLAAGAGEQRSRESAGIIIIILESAVSLESYRGNKKKGDQGE